MTAAATEAETTRGFWSSIGPGVLFTGAAVGVSHLVQSTRAGAAYGFSLALFVLLALLVKYPAFRFGPHYTAATGTSLLEGYRRQGRWALVAYGLLTLGTMFTVQAAVTLVTAGLAKHILSLEASPITISAGLLVASAGLLAVGQYRWLDRLAKVVVAILAVLTLGATALALPEVDFAETSFLPAFGAMDAAAWFFVAALVGWMPSAIDVSVWQSLWTLERARDTGHRPTVRQSTVDFHVGYMSTGLLAFCFLALGASVMAGQELAPSAGAFAGQVVDLYGETLGSWSRPLIAVCAFLVMLSTTVTVIDGFPRALSVLAARFAGPESRGALGEAQQTRRVYWGSLVTLGVGSLVVLVAFLSSLKAMVDLATTLSFLTAPVLSSLNHRAVTSAEVPEADRPAPWLVYASLVAILAQGAFALYYLWLRFIA